MVPESGSLTGDQVIYVAGHRGMVGSAMVRLLRRKGFSNLVTRTSAELDLTDQAAVRELFSDERIDYVVLAAAKVGGIHANSSYPADFIYRNLMIQANVIHEAWAAGVRRLLFLGSSCIYPKLCAQPMKESYLLSGLLEPTNEPYAIAKIAGIKTCESYNRQHGTDFRAVMPTNLYGPEDNYHLEHSHVIPAIIRKCHLARLAEQGNRAGIRRDEARFGAIPDDVKAGLFEAGGTALKDRPYVQLWGSGTGRREFLHVDDMAAGCFTVMNMGRDAYASCLAGDRIDEMQTRAGFLNIGTGKDCTIKEVAALIREIVGFGGEIRYDSDQPDGTPQKLLDVTRITRSGWRPRFSLRDGLIDAYHWYRGQIDEP
jgi:GDP-L-fucose synthase